MRASKAIRSVLRAAASSVGPDRNSSKNCHKPYRYSAFDLLRHGFSQAHWPRTWRKHDLESSALRPRRAAPAWMKQRP